MQIHFKGKIWRSGNSSVVTIPSDFVENGLLPDTMDLAFSVEVPDAQ